VTNLRRLVQSYSSHIAVPWRLDAAPSQRMIFCIYDGKEELRLRAKIGEFELATREAGHKWMQFDLTNTFSNWLAGQKYREKYFAEPQLLATLLPRYLDYIEKQFQQALVDGAVDASTVVALQGVGSLFGFLKVSEVVDRLAPAVPGRLLVLFPGSYENNNYRLLDGYDGWNYLAVPITADREF